MDADDLSNFFVLSTLLSKANRLVPELLLGVCTKFTSIYFFHAHCIAHLEAYFEYFLAGLIHGATYHTGKPIESSFSGRAASCTEGVLGAYLDNTPKVVVPGNGDRVWANCQDHEMIMAVPGSRLSEVVEGLEKTHKKGIRYPIPTYLRYQPEVGFTIPLADIFKPEEVDKLS